MTTSRALTNKTAVSIISVVFFMWGFLTCLNDILIPHLKSIFSLNYAQSALIQFTFFGAYFIMSLPAGKVVARFGYKTSLSLGLLIAAVGALLFFPAAKFVSYSFFLSALFVLATGITLLQVTANPYVVLLGSEETASSRLNLAQALNSLGTTLAPKFGSLFILSTVVLTAAEMAQMSPVNLEAYKLEQAQTVQGPYLFLAGVLVLLAVMIYLFKLPQFPGHETSENDDAKTSFLDALKYKHVLYGVIALFAYVGAEVSIGSFLINFISSPDIANVSEKVAAGYVPFYWGGAMIGRFIGVVLLRKIRPGTLLGMAGAIAATLLLVTMNSHGLGAAYTVLAIGLFNSIMFPTIFSLGVRGLGPLTEKASSLLIMAIVGGAVLPLLQGTLADNIGLQKAFALPLVCYLFIAFYGFKGSAVKGEK